MISIVIMTYNRANFLKTCLESLLKQDISKKEYELIVVDDNSSDETKKIVLSFQKKFSNFRYFKHRKNKGVSAARNTGIKYSKGEIVAFIADDYVLPNNYLKTIKTFFEKNNSYDAVSFDITAQKNSFLSELNDLYYKTKLKGTLNILKFNFLTKHIKNYSKKEDELLPVSGAAAFKKEVFNKIGLFDELFHYSEDNDLAARMKANNLKQYQSSLIVFRDNEHSIFKSIKNSFYSGKHFFYLKTKHGSNYKPFFKNNFFNCLKLFIFTPVLSIIRIFQLKSFFKKIFFFPFILLFDYAFFIGFSKELFLIKFRKLFNY